MIKLNLFYQEPDPDRWFKGDRYPRRIIRNFLPTRGWISGHQRIFYNLKAGLDRLGVEYRVNDYRYTQAHPDEIACIIGKPHILSKIQWRNPILFGAAIFSHPCDAPADFYRHPIMRFLVPGDWVAQMWSPILGDRVHVWPTGIDLQQWQPTPQSAKDIDFIIYDKIRWQRPELTRTLLQPICETIQQQGFTSQYIRYGDYEAKDYEVFLQRAKAMIFLCEHETQGIAYQEALASGVPIFAWDRGGYWQDPNDYPHKVEYGPVTSVPYWDSRCGLKFQDFTEFNQQLSQFWHRCQQGQFSPRAFIQENLTLEKCARDYIAHVDEMQRVYCG